MGIITDILKELPLNAVLRDKLQELERKYDTLEIENNRLKEENRKLKNELKELKNTSKLSKPEEKILILLSSGNIEVTPETISSQIGLSLTKTEYYLGRMHREYVSSQDWCDGRPSEYHLTQKGRQYLVENNLIE